MKDKETITKALKACSEFLCGECPYQYLDDNEYSLRCIHTLIKDIDKMLNAEDADEVLNRN